MKIFFLLLLIPFIVIAPAYGQILSDATGLVNRIDVETGGHIFEVQVVSNFQILDSEFNDKNNKLTLYIESGLENNLGEIIIPQQLFDEELIFYLNDEEINPKVNSSQNILFVTLEFSGIGKHTLEVLDPQAMNTLSQTNPSEVEDSMDSSTGGGCLIATATYGSELAPQVQQLRELRDNSLLQTNSGKTFLNSFNAFYYSFSPTIADFERQNFIFKEMVKLLIIPMISTLSILNYVDIDSEETVVGVGLSIIMLNIGLYFVAPTLGIIYGRRILLR